MTGLMLINVLLILFGPFVVLAPGALIARRDFGPANRRRAGLRHQLVFARVSAL